MAVGGNMYQRSGWEKSVEIGGSLQIISWKSIELSSIYGSSWKPMENSIEIHGRSVVGKVNGISIRRLVKVDWKVYTEAHGSYSGSRWKSIWNRLVDVELNTM